MGKLDYIFRYNNYISNIENSDKEDDINLYNESNNIMLSEGLIKTFPIGSTIRILEKRFPETNITYTGEEIVISNNKIELSEYIALINNLGYYISQVSKTGDIYQSSFKESEVYLEIVLEAKFDIKVEDIPKTLYHSTHKKNLNKILKNGLVPKSESKLSKHPDRIYLTNRYEHVYYFSKYILDFYSKVNFYEHDSVILKIDTTTDLDIRLYVDINLSETGYYTIDNIPPKYITHLNK